MSVTIKIKVNEKLYLRDPEQTALGRKIIDNSIQLIDELGFELFTFKKLAKRIGSTEASVYRYFENKHKLLVYLISWYWHWLEYQIDYQTNNIEKPEHKLKIVLKVLSESFKYDPEFSHIDEEVLGKIVVSESAKTYLTKKVETEHQEGFFQAYKNLCNKISKIIKEIKPDYSYPVALVSTIIETAHEQIFFAEHLPTLTEIKVFAGDKSEIVSFLENLVFSVLNMV